MDKFAYVSAFTFIGVCRMESFSSETLILIFRRDEYRFVGEHELYETQEYYFYRTSINCYIREERVSFVYMLFK